MDDRDESPRFHHEYSFENVAQLLGLREGWGRQGRRHVTIVDLLSWAKDPGGDAFWFQQLVRRDPREAWMARRGSLAPDGELGTVLWDVLRAVKQLPSLRDQAIVALTAFDFTQDEVAKILRISRREVKRVLLGDEERGLQGAVEQIAASMNGEKVAA